MVVERDLALLGLIGLEDPPRPAPASKQRSRLPARTMAAEVGIIGPDGTVLEGRDLPADKAALGALLDRNLDVPE